MFIFQISLVGSADFKLFTPIYGKLLPQSHLPGKNAALFSAAVAIHIVPIFVRVPPGTHYCLVGKVDVDSKLGQSILAMISYFMGRLNYNDNFIAFKIYCSC